MSTFAIGINELQEGIQTIDQVIESLALKAYQAREGTLANCDADDFLLDVPELAMLRLRLRDAIDCIQRHEAKTA